MRIKVVPAGAAPFELEVDDASQIGQVKQTIEPIMLNQGWTAASMTLFHGSVELENASTLQEHNITEMSTLHAFAYDEADFQDMFLSDDTQTQTLSTNHDDEFSRGDTGLSWEDLMAIPIGSVDVKMLLPHNFQASLVLNHSATHHFQTCGQLRDKIESDPPAWLPKLEAYAILSNVNAFLVERESVDDFFSRKNGGLALVRSCTYGALHQGRGYKSSHQAPFSISIEKPAGKFKISGEISLERFEIVGDLWTRRRIHVEGDDTVSLVQWMSTCSKRKDTLKEDVSDVGKAVGELKVQLGTVAIDVTDLKKDVASVKQGMTDIQATLTALVGHLSQQAPQDTDARTA